ncbi:hypothetical protein B7P43_G15748 [Cryptotermes secundus]|uniref:Ig-like domain-containing protein n=1 Tax=Cryptotermes secundus TaxID=105785 RepID=A0A2J7QWZ7_9NEOP|nr:hypothetical protein B7P43_G15748 [Cryptotermes secundus]
MIWVPNQLVGAPAGTNVTIDCHTEAYPRAISYWVYENVMILPTKKYGTETTENSYRAHMKLTIRDLREKDFGNYRCISKNSLGETEGSIRLYEIPMPSSPPKATEVRSSGASKEGECHGLIEIITTFFLGGTEENDENTQDSKNLAEIRIQHLLNTI